MPEYNENLAKGYLPQLPTCFVCYRLEQLLSRLKQRKLPLMVVAQLRATLYA